MQKCRNCSKENPSSHYCSACQELLGLCKGCKCRKPDLPGFKNCSRCRDRFKRRADRLFEQVGQRGMIALWQIRELERSNKFAEQLAEKILKRTLTNANA